MAGMSLTLAFPCPKSPSPPFRLITFKKPSSQSSSRASRSLGCANCKRRKVRCDEALPACERCRKAKLDCPGYASPEPPQKRASFPFKDQTQLTIAKAEGSWTSSRRANYTQAPPGESSLPVPEAPVLNLNATSTQLYSSFLESFLPQDRNSSQAAYSYLTDLPSTTASHHALQNATKALSFIRLSATSNDHNLVQHSRVSYGNSLSQLRLALSDPDMANQDETLATILMLGFYEMHKAVQEPTVGQAQHYSGALRYIQMRGPESFRSDQSRLLLKNHRSVMLMTGLRTHKRILYDRPEWLGVTRSVFRVSDWSAVLDIGSHVPGMLEATDALVSNPNPASMASSAKATLSRLRALRVHFAEWQQHTSEEEAECWLAPLAEVPGMSSELATSAPFDTAFTGRAFNDVHNFLLHNMFVCNVLRAALQVQHYRMIAMSDDGEESEAEAFQGGLEDDYKTHLGLLVQCFPFMLRPESNTMGWMVLATVVWFAGHATREVGMQEIAAWCDEVAEDAARNKALGPASGSFNQFPPLRPELD